MAHSNPNLIPSVITDKNGKTTTVHKKAITESKVASKVPAPTLVTATPTKRTLASRTQSIETVFADDPKRKLNKTKTQALIKFAKTEHLELLDEALDSFSEASPHEQMIVKSIFLPLTSRIRDVDCIYELLAVRTAFNSEATRTDGANILEYVLEEYVRGVRHARTGDYYDKLDLSNEYSRTRATALVRFAYELRKRSLWSDHFSPTYSAQVGRGTDESSREWESKDLVNLISDFPERVGEMIEVAIEHKTSDAQRIWSIMQHEGHSSLTVGAL